MVTKTKCSLGPAGPDASQSAPRPIELADAGSVKNSVQCDHPGLSGYRAPTSPTRFCCQPSRLPVPIAVNASRTVRVQPAIRPISRALVGVCTPSFGTPRAASRQQQAGSDADARVVQKLPLALQQDAGVSGLAGRGGKSPAGWCPQARHRRLGSHPNRPRLPPDVVRSPLVAHLATCYGDTPPKSAWKATCLPVRRRITRALGACHPTHADVHLCDTRMLLHGSIGPERQARCLGCRRHRASQATSKLSGISLSQR